MGSAFKFGILMRNLLAITIRACYIFICNHPFLVCFVGFLIFLCTWFPFVFSILVYVSPVLVCTAVLLGTLLFFGQSNVHEVHKEKKVTNNVLSSFQTGISESATVISGRDENTSVIEESSIEVATLVADKVNKVEQDVGLLSYVPVVYKNSLNIQREKQVKVEREREVGDQELKAKVFTSDVEAVDEEEGSDDIESSSPDASMADIIPMLDELDPLLDLEAPQPVASSGIAFEKSQKSDGSIESDEGTEIQGEEDEEDIESGKEDDSKSAIRWTEDDQKNLMDLGTLELERNQRLENLIARRKAWRMMTEKNLIDLESADVPLNVTVSTISTTRRNPFDIPNDSYDAMGLPPIPGSAPSILHPRQNPFDIPFDLTEEKIDPKVENPPEEFPMFNQNNTFFRRHESFSMGPSVLGMTKHERQDNYWKPVFVSEQIASEGTSYSPFQRQSSEVSDSKLSFVNETESVSSIDQDERMSNEQPQQTESVSTTSHVSGRVECGSQNSEEVDSAERAQVERKNVLHHEVAIVLGGVENPSEMESERGEGEGQIHEDDNNIGETNLRREVVEGSSCKSSQSSSSEVIDNIPDVKQESLANEQQEEKNHLQESRISAQASEEDSELQFVSSEVEDIQHNEPVYDSSPPAGRKLQSFYSRYFDSTTDFSEGTLLPALAKKTANDEPHDQGWDDKTSSHDEFHTASSQQHIEQNDTNLRQNLDKKEYSSISNCQSGQFEVKPPSQLENNLSSLDKYAPTPSISDHHESQVGSIQGDSTSNIEVGEFYDAMNKFYRTNSYVTHYSSETPEFKSPDESPKDAKKEEFEQGIPILEARSAEDIDLAFQQLQEGVDVEEVILPSMIKDQLAHEKSKCNLEANSDFQVVEARSLDDINTAFELVPESDRRRLQKTLDLKDGSVEMGANEVVEYFDVESGNEETKRSPVSNLKNMPKSSSDIEVKSQSD